MQRTRRAASLAVTASAAMVASMALHSPAAADPTGPDTTSTAPGSDITQVAPDFNHGKRQPFDQSSLERARAKAALQKQRITSTATIGQSKTWLAEDDSDGSVYVKDYTLRGLGDHIQVWVANDRAFPDGDCRNVLDLTNITDAQVNSFVHEFDTNIYPKESKAFATPPALDGSDAPLPGMLGYPADYYQVDSTQADDIVVLVDNVRDANFYAPSSPDGQTYIAGFFYSMFNDLTNRNIMTIDAYDWLHRTGANPPDNSGDAAYQACAAASGAPRPHLYEGTFAHEYQHLLENYSDPDEVSWVNEGLSDWAQSLVGYVNTAVAPNRSTADSHLACIMGYLPKAYGGPENSLTRWGDQGGPEILCDYGAAYSFMTYLSDHYGSAFMSALHKAPGNGLRGLNQTLRRQGKKGSAQTLLHRWAAMLAVDNALAKHRKLTGGHRADFSTRSLRAMINWRTRQAYSSKGAPANGSDYVRLRTRKGAFLKARQLRSITFAGARTLTPDPLRWRSVATPPDATSAGTACGSIPRGTGTSALYSGCGMNLDRAAVRQVQVPTSGGRLGFDALWDTEKGWDFGFVQVSTNGGRTWKSLSTADTTRGADPGAIGGVRSNLPGFTGDSGTWQHETVDLSAYAGKKVLLAFRYVTDPAVAEGGFWVRNVHVGGTAVPTGSTAGWRSATQVHPVAVHGYTVQLLGYDTSGRTWITHLRLDRRFHATLRGHRLARALGRQASTVAAIVTFDDPSETASKQARYKLRVNKVLQPGG